MAVCVLARPSDRPPNYSSGRRSEVPGSTITASPLSQLRPLGSLLPKSSRRTRRNGRGCKRVRLCALLEARAGPPNCPPWPRVSAARGFGNPWSAKTHFWRTRGARDGIPWRFLSGQRLPGPLPGTKFGQGRPADLFGPPKDTFGEPGVRGTWVVLIPNGCRPAWLSCALAGFSLYRYRRRLVWRASPLRLVRPALFVWPSAGRRLLLGGNPCPHL